MHLGLLGNLYIKLAKTVYCINMNFTVYKYDFASLLFVWGILNRLIFI